MVRSRLGLRWRSFARWARRRANLRFLVGLFGSEPHIDSGAKPALIKTLETAEEHVLLLVPT